MSRRDDTFILYYWNEYEEYTEENPTCYYCLSESTIQICLNALRFVGWPTRWRNDKDDNNPRFPKNSTWDKIEALGALAQKELLTDMSCDLEAGFSALAEAIENASPNSGLSALASAIASIQSGGCSVNVNCCSGGGGRNGTGGVGPSAPPHNPTIPGVPGVDPPPEGYESWEEFDADKCAIATYLVNTLIDDLERATTINFDLQTVATLAVILTALLVDPIPGDEIIVLCGILIAVHTNAAQILADMSSCMNDNKAELICAFYAAETSAQAEQNFEDRWSDFWYASPYTNVLYDWAAIQSINTMVTSAMTNLLFEKQSDRVYPTADCVSCIDYWEFYNGSLIEEESDGVYLLAPEGPSNCAPVGDMYTCSAIRLNSGFPLVGNWTIELASGSLTNVNSGSPNSCNYVYRGLYCNDVAFLEHSATPPSYPVAMSSFTIRSTSPFTLRITIEDEGDTECS